MLAVSNDDELNKLFPSLLREYDRYRPLSRMCRQQSKEKHFFIWMYFFYFQILKNFHIYID
jgi:hypothetical protein